VGYRNESTSHVFDLTLDFSGSTNMKVVVGATVGAEVEVDNGGGGGSGGGSWGGLYCGGAGVAYGGGGGGGAASLVGELTVRQVVEAKNGVLIVELSAADPTKAYAYSLKMVKKRGGWGLERGVSRVCETPPHSLARSFAHSSYHPYTIKYLLNAAAAPPSSFSPFLLRLFHPESLHLLEKFSDSTTP
jgi:hypothetical protein